jgi:glycine betaine/proline transport system substrate-binding protein
MKNYVSLLCGFILISVSLISTGRAQAEDAPDCSPTRFGTVGWLDAGSAVSIVTALLRGLGYDSTIERHSAPMILAGLKNQDLDVFLEIMIPTMGNTLRPYILDNSVKLLRRNLSGTKYTLAVNTPAANLGIEHFDMLGQHADALRRTIHGVEPGADGNRLIQAMINENQFGLGEFSLVESSEDGLIQSILIANRDSVPMVFLAFEPHPMNVRFDLTYLEGGDDVFGPAFGGAQVYTGIRTPLVQQCPNLVRLLENVEFSLQMINEVMTAILELNAQPLVAAVAWMRQQPNVLDAWLEGVTTRDGQPGLAAIQKFIGLN